MTSDHIIVTGAKEHNLKNVTVKIPKLRFVVFSGVSGSGKTSLAFDTVFAEGQRRYIESLSTYARQFLGQLERPKYDGIQGLTPTIAIEQKSASSNPRSTVGTITEIHDYLRVLFARAGRQHCHLCGKTVSKQEPAQILREIISLAAETSTSKDAAGTKTTILAPVVRNRKGEFKDLLKSLEADGFVRVRINDVISRISELEPLDKNKKHDLDVIIDRALIREGSEARLTDSIETALRVGKGRVIVILEDGQERIFSEHLACEDCGVSFPELTPQLFSFNNPAGACPECNGLGRSLTIDPSKVIPDPTLSISAGAIEPWAKAIEDNGLTGGILQGYARKHNIDLEIPFKDLPTAHQHLILFGHSQRIPVEWKSKSFNGSLAVRFEGVANMLLRRLRETKSEEMRAYYQRFLTDQPCEKCGGHRLKQEALAVKISGFSISDLSDMAIGNLIEVIENIRINSQNSPVTEELSREILSRLNLLKNLGLGYLTLSRGGASLSGGEAQRIRLASQLGSELTGVTYILDEPSIGLHPRDNGRLIQTLERLRDLGNTVLVVEHDRDAIMAADHIIEFGPGAGIHGGEIIFEGRPADMLKSASSLTGAYISGRKTIPIPDQRRKSEHSLIIKGATGHNLKNIDVTIPLGTFTVVSGVSGAGKSSLVTKTLSKALQNHFFQSASHCLPFDSIEGLKHLDKVIVINQEPIGRTPRSNPATYTKLFDHIRKVFAETRESRTFGYQPGRFSFNVRGGRCENCQGAGAIRVEMHFLPDVFVTCDECGGKRFNEATLRVKYKDLSISDVLNLTVDQAAEVFKNTRGISKILTTLQAVGLGYIGLGQPSTTLSGGEAQRIKLSRELARSATGRTIYIMDEPSTGLHFDDVAKLLKVIDSLVSVGNTVLMIEHNLEIMKVADHIIDLGPEGGEGGGYVVASGTPEQLADNPMSCTGTALKDILFPK
jgi:excinuclease ABC subunit A